MNPMEKIVTFCIFMENNEGILGKAPSYIKEKWILCEAAQTHKQLQDILDRINQQKLDLWLERWGTYT